MQSAEVGCRAGQRSRTRTYRRTAHHQTGSGEFPLAGTGANTFHVLAMRDSRYNIEPGNGAPDCNPVVDSHITGKLDEDILDYDEVHADKVGPEDYVDDGRIRTFMEGTDFHRMWPKSELKYGSTRYVLASEAGSYIACSNDATADMGLREIAAGTYLLRWFDTASGHAVEQVIAVAAGDRTWSRPSEIGTEAALYVKRLDGVKLTESK